jgi:hypothetical protein
MAHEVGIGFKAGQNSNSYSYISCYSDVMYVLAFFDLIAIKILEDEPVI